MRGLLTDAQAARALELYRAGVPAGEIAAGLGVSVHAVNNILAGRTYRHVPGVRPGPRRPAVAPGSTRRPSPRYVASATRKG